jgi:ATP-dependent DNA ligase
VLDGEIVVPVGSALSFSALQARLHPAASRVERLSRETPARFIVFDCLQVGSRVQIDQPLDTRRHELQELESSFPAAFILSPCTRDVAVAEDWLERTGGALDGVIAKRRDEPYRPGERAMYKHKVERTADCVVGGFRYDKSGSNVASLLLGLHDEQGLLHHVGYSSSFPDADRAKLARKLEPLKDRSAFTGSAPGGPSRWSKPGTSNDWVPIEPALVAEFAYDQVTGGRFRHGTTFRRWRPDKKPAQCTFEQLTAELRPEQLEAILRDAEAYSDGFA